MADFRNMGVGVPPVRHHPLHAQFGRTLFSPLHERDARARIFRVMRSL